MSSKVTWLTGNLYKMEIRDREAKEEEILKVMQLDPIVRDREVIDSDPNFMDGVKAIFKFISILCKQIWSFQEAKVKLLSSWQQEDDLEETVGSIWRLFNDSVFLFYFFTSEAYYRKNISLRYKKTVKI